MAGLPLGAHAAAAAAVPVPARPRGLAVSQVAIVTGAARGIGAATVIALADAGWSVVAVDRCADDPRLPYALGTEEELAAVVARAGAASDVRPVVGDASRPTERCTWTMFFCRRRHDNRR